MEDSASKDESIFLWILEQERQKNRDSAVEETARKSHMYAVNEKNHCSKCKKTFDEPRLVQYYACPHCLNKLEEKSKIGCHFWFGFLSQKDKGESIPQECIECEKVMECMLNQNNVSGTAMSEIKKWY